MRLLNVNTFELQEFYDQTRPPYAITSHRWARQDEEVTYDEILEHLSPTRRQHIYAKAGFKKIAGFAGVIRTLLAKESIEWLWIDTCCIDKRNHSELSEALNSMFRWYKEARVCLAYLHDVKFEASNSAANIAAFKDAEWLKRGWTLQELLAPETVLFLDSHWDTIGYKTGDTPSITIDEAQLGGKLNELIISATGIPRAVIENFSNAEHLSLEEKRSWMAGRQTTRIEDRAYCQLGIFGVFIPPIYGEGEHAFVRLEEEIEKSINRRAGGRSRFSLRTFLSQQASPATSNNTPVDDRPEDLMAIAKFTFEADQPGDLGFRKGDVISIIRRTNSVVDWWVGRIGDRRGIFPGNYVDIAPQPGQAIALFSFVPEEGQPGDLFFSKGDVISIVQRFSTEDVTKPRWWKGRIGDREGLFPTNYVQIV